MEWVKWVLPLIALVVWIVVNLARPKQDEVQPPRPRPPRPPLDSDTAHADKQQNKSELSRFLRDLERRKAAEQKKIRAKETLPKVLPVTPQARALEAQRREERFDTPPQRPETRPRPPRPATPPPLPPVIPVHEAPLTPVPPLAPLAVPPPAPPVSPAKAPATTGAYVIQQRIALASGSNVTRQVREMLRNPHSIRAALVLQEVLGPPLARRRK